MHVHGYAWVVISYFRPSLQTAFFNVMWVVVQQRDGEVEQAENAAKQRRLQGSSVYYGDSIQLQHTLTGKYVCVSTTDTSLTENTKLRVKIIT